MDQVKRAASRLRRLQRALLFLTGRRVDLEPFSLRPFVTGPEGLQLRRTIDDNVVAFVPPSLPLTAPGLICTDVLVEFTKSGFWTLNAHVEALVQTEVVFIVGFVTNEHGYFGSLIGALNWFRGGPTNVTSSSSAATVSIVGVSNWIELNYDTARGEGVTFRVNSTTDLQLSVGSLIQQWAATLPRELYRPLSILDTDYSDSVAWGVSFTGGSVLDQPGEEPGLSFEVSLRFE